VSTIVLNPVLFADITDAIADHYKDAGVQYIAGISALCFASCLEHVVSLIRQDSRVEDLCLAPLSRTRCVCRS
jgi:hypothetical protein